MKSFLAVTFLIASVASEATFSSFEEAFKNCKIETGVADQYADQVRNYDLSFDDVNGKCFHTCLAKVAGWSDAQNNIVTTELETKTKISVDKLRAARDACNKIRGSSSCDENYSRFQCLFKTVPEIPAQIKL